MADSTNNRSTAGEVSLEVVTDTALEQPDMNHMKYERFNRNRDMMRKIDAQVSDKILPNKNEMCVEDSAAIRIQAYYRGYKDRQKYIALLYQQYQKEYELQREKTLAQVEEGELLVENHRLQVEYQDNVTTRKNRRRQMETSCVTIQRAWKKYLGKKKQLNQCDRRCGEGSDVDTDSMAQPMSLSTSIDSLRNARSDDDLLSDAELTTATDAGRQSLQTSYHDDVSQSGRRANKNILLEHVDTDPESVVSDYSEMADAIKEHLANVQIIRQEDLDSGNALPNELLVEGKLGRVAGESDEEYAKRLRKLNFLSLAQEFAELKKIDSDALPFGAHKAHLQSGLSDGSTSEVSESSCVTTPMELTKPFPVTIATPATGQSINIPNPHSNNGKSKEGDSINKEPSNTTSKQGESVATDQCQVDGLITETSEGCSGSAVNRQLTAFEKQHAAIAPHNRQPTATSQSSNGSRKQCGNHGNGYGDFDVYNMESTLPQMDWDKLEHELQRAAEEERQKKTHKNEREEILRKLAMGEEEGVFGTPERTFKKTNMQNRYQGGQSLQLCFMNEELTADQAAAADNKQADEGQSTPAIVTNDITIETETDENLMTTQQQLQQEATIALAQVPSIAKMQLQVEKKVKKKSPIAEITGIPELGDGKILQLTLPMLQDMSYAQLQVVVNDLHTQIENLNIELVNYLIERDDLHMEQDSMLVDIEDLHRRAEELADRLHSTDTGQKS